MVLTHADLKRKIDAIEKKVDRKFADHEQHFKVVFLAIEQLLAEPLLEPAKKTKKKRIGY